MTTLATGLLAAWAVINAVVSVLNVKQSRVNSRNAIRNFDIVCALKPEELDGQKVMDAINKHRRVTGRPTL